MLEAETDSEILRGFKNNERNEKAKCTSFTSKRLLKEDLKIL
jgi:hypothetical protein